MISIAFSGTSLQNQGLDLTLDVIQRSGFNALEFSGILTPIPDNTTARKNLRDQIRDAGLAIEALRWRGPGGVQAAKAIGAPVLATSFGARESDREAFLAEIENFKKMGKEAADAGVRICVKPHVGNYVHSTSTMCEFIECVDSEHVGLMWDPSHLWRANELPEETLPSVLDHLFAVRLRDHISRDSQVDPAETQVPGNGEIDFRAIIDILLTRENLKTYCIEINNWGHWDEQNQWVKWERDRVWESEEESQVIRILTLARENLGRYIESGISSSG